MNTFSHKHVVVMAPAVSNDDRAHWIHFMARNLDGVDEAVLQPDAKIEYIDRSGCIYPVIHAELGYLIEIPKRETFALFDWLAEELGVDKVDGDSYYSDTLDDHHITAAGIVEGKDHLIWMYSMDRPHARYLALKPPLTKVLQDCTLDGTDATVRAVDVSDYENGAEAWIKKNLPHLVKVEMQTLGVPYTIWTVVELSDCLQYN